MIVSSGFDPVAVLDPVDDAALAAETPVFAADLPFARETGGERARAFLAALPADWREVPLVVDSALVWLCAGASPGPRVFHHQTCSGAESDAGAAADAERAAEHIACCMGVACPEQFVVGDVDGTDLAIGGTDPRAVAAAMRQREDRLAERLASGRLRLATAPLWSVYRFRWGALRRFPRAERSGFHFWIRATRRTERSAANLLRNMMTVTL